MKGYLGTYRAREMRACTGIYNGIDRVEKLIQSYKQYPAGVCGFLALTV